jgi:hypothetical protein
MLRIVAFGAGLAGLVAISGQGAVALITNYLPDSANLIPLVIQIGRWAQLAFILLLSIFLFLFALSKRAD